MKKGRRWILGAALLAGLTGPLASTGQAQYDRHRDYDNGYRRTDAYDDRRDREYERHHQGGIGPGKGALIGGAGGAVLGALFGGGVKGALIGGGIGAGGGAILGKVNQDSRDNHDYRDYRDDRHDDHHHH